MSLKGLSGIFLRVILPVFWCAGHDNRPPLKHALGKRNLGRYEATGDHAPALCYCTMSEQEGQIEKEHKRLERNGDLYRDWKPQV